MCGLAKPLEGCQRRIWVADGCAELHREARRLKQNKPHGEENQQPVAEEHAQAGDDAPGKTHGPAGGKVVVYPLG